MARIVRVQRRGLGLRALSMAFLFPSSMGMLLVAIKLHSELNDLWISEEVIGAVVISIGLLASPIFIGIFGERVKHVMALSALSAIGWCLGLIAGLYTAQATATRLDLQIPSATMDLSVPTVRAWVVLPAWIMVSVLIYFLRSLMVRSRHAVPGGCLGCGYHIGDDPLASCPECGRAWDPQEKAPRWPGRWRRAWRSFAAVSIPPLLAGLVIQFIYLQL